MTYKIELTPVPHPQAAHTWMLDVEATSPTERVLLRNRMGNLEQVQIAMTIAIAKHALNPWGEAEPRP